MKIRVTEIITYAGDGDLQSFCDYSDAEGMMRSWAQYLKEAYLTYLRAEFHPAIPEVSTPVSFDVSALHDELTVLLIWDEESPAGSGETGFQDVTEESRGMYYAVRCDAWAAWQALHPPDATD